MRIYSRKLDMCPNHGTFRRPYVIQDRLPYQDWLDTALCSRSVYFQSRDSGRILCTDCFAYITHSERRSCRVTIRHFVHIGTEEDYEECSECHVILVDNRIIRDCGFCADALRGFVVYLQSSGDDPYNSPEPTILSISQNSVEVDNQSSVH